MGKFLWAIGGKHGLGKTLDDTTVYSIHEDKWYSSINNELQPMPQSVQGAAWTLYKNKIYCFGGKTKQRKGWTDKIQLYDIKNDSWEIIGEMPKPRGKLSKFCPVVGKSIFIFGGDCEKGSTRRVNWNWRYDLEKQEWDTEVQDAPRPQSFPVATYHKGWLYYTTGNTSQLPFNRYHGALNQRYNIKEDRWETMQPCPVPTTDGAGDKHKGEFHYVGGWNTNPTYYNPARKRFQGRIKKLHLVYNYDNNEWRFEKKLDVSWHHGGCVSCGDYLWMYLGNIDEEVGIRKREMRFISKKAKEQNHTNRIFRWDKEWQEKTPAPVRKMNFGTICTEIGPKE